MHSDDDFAVVPWAFDGDADDKISESHCSDGTNCIADVGDLGRSFDCTAGPSSRDNCSDCCCLRSFCCCSRDCSRGHDRHVHRCPSDYSGAAAAAVEEGPSGFRPTAFDSDSELVRVSAKRVVPRRNCSVCRLLPAAVPG